jgi:hypothetical protein
VRAVSGEGYDGPWATVGAVRRAGRVELKIIVPDGCHRTLLAALHGTTRARTVYYLDTVDLDLAARGLVVRARTGGRVDSVVKLRGAEPRGRSRRRFPNLTVEVDALPEHSWWTTAVAQDLRPSAVRAAVHGRRPLRTLLSGEQRRFLRDHARGGPALDDLVVHGPVLVTRTAGRGSGICGRLVLESWVYPDGSRLLEVSTKCRPERVRRVAAATGRFLDRLDVDLTAPQRTKTAASLEYFAA